MQQELIRLGADVLQFAGDHGTALGAIAALVGIPILIFQIRQARKQEKHRLDARRMAALSTLPMTLSGINRWATAAAKSQRAVYKWVTRDEVEEPQPPYEPPPSPDHLIDAIERMIEAAPRDRIARTLTAIVAQIQVLAARLSEAEDFTPTKIRGQAGVIDDNLLMAASIYSLADSLYDDARKLSERVPSDFDRMASVLNILGIRDGNFSSTTGLRSSGSVAR